MLEVIRKSKVLLMMLVLLLAFMPLTVFAESGKKTEINYVSLGDSLAASVLSNQTIGDGYVGKIVTNLESDGYHVNLTNKGIPGGVSADILAQLGNVPELASADIVTISSGANDVLQDFNQLDAGSFDPTYFSAVAVEQIKGAAKATALTQVEEAIKQVNQSTDEAITHIGAVRTAVEDLVEKTVPYQAYLPADVAASLEEISHHVELTSEKIATVKENTVRLNESMTGDFAEISKAINAIDLSLTEATNELDGMHGHIALIESKVEEFSAVVPAITEISSSVTAVKEQASLVQNNLATAKQGLGSGLTALQDYSERLVNIGSSVEKAQEIQQVMMGLPGKVPPVGQNITETILTIQQMNPNAKIYVLGYYNALPYLPAEIQTQFTIPVLKGLNEAIQGAATATGAVYVPSYELFDGAHTTYLPNPADVHPNEAGYQLIAGAFMNKISESFPEVVVDEEANPSEDEEEGSTPVNGVEDEDGLPVNGQETDKEQDDSVQLVGKKDDQALVASETEKKEGTNHLLPQTATNLYNWLLAGSILLILGTGTWMIQRKRRQVSNEI